MTKAGNMILFACLLLLLVSVASLDPCAGCKGGCLHTQKGKATCRKGHRKGSLEQCVSKKDLWCPAPPPPAYSCSTSITDMGVSWLSSTGQTEVLLVTWNLIPDSKVDMILMDGYASQFQIQSPTTAHLYRNIYDAEGNFIELTKANIDLYVTQNGCPRISSTYAYVAPCFLAGALVTMADRSTKPIEDVRVGDVVLGAFGEDNAVIALHRPLLGNNTMTNINNEHHTSSHHPHISIDKKFYSVKPAVVMADTYGRSHEVLDEYMKPYQRFLEGLKPGRVQLLEAGVELKTVEGSRVATFLETYEMSPDTQLYNLVLGGSHTYHVDGYAVTGWPREDDFDYDAWGPR